jgi:hypothetical protein
MLNDLTLPPINGEARLKPSEIRSAEKPTASKPPGGLRPYRPSILHKASPLASVKGSNEDLSSEPGSRGASVTLSSVARQSILVQKNHTEKTDLAGEDLRTSSPAIMNKPVIVKSDSEKKSNGYIFRAHTEAEGQRNIHSPTIPAGSKISPNRTHRPAPNKCAVPNGESALGKKEAESRKGMCC